MPYDRIHNFAAGPAVLPLQVIEAVREQLPNLDNTGIGLMEISHRSKTFDDVVRSAQQRLRQLLVIPDTHEVLFLQGGASLQFLMVPMNILNPGDKADYINTGTWSTKAIKEARSQGDIAEIWTGRPDGFRRVPTPEEYSVRDDAVYLHYTTNNTIAGTEFHWTPGSADKPLVADASSDIASMPIDVSRHAIIYAGAQKNLGPSGVTIVIVDKTILERCQRPIPTMLDYRIHIGKKTLFNTPCTFGIFAVDQVLKWIEGVGGVEAIAAQNRTKANKLYTELDSSDFWVPHAQPESRSLMNVTWRIADNELEPIFVKEAFDAGLSGLKGHRSVGGLRASIYNACPPEAVDELVSFMQVFKASHG